MFITALIHIFREPCGFCVADNLPLSLPIPSFDFDPDP
jgi:hypothetical protein